MIFYNFKLIVPNDIDLPAYAECYDEDNNGNIFVSVLSDNLDIFNDWCILNNIKVEEC
jgi:hypothetical protein